MVIQLSDLPPDPGGIAVTSYLCGVEVRSGCGPGNATASFHRAGEDRATVTFDELPDHLVEALIATEDQSFFSHPGVDPRGMARAAYRFVRGDAITQGGSTLTQQYVKNAFDDGDRSWARKFREIGRALRLEQALTDACQGTELGQADARRCAKEEILVGYLNTAYFGRGASSIRSASWAYFATEVDDLTVGQAAFLVGLLRNPNGAEPDTNREEAERRRDVTLDLMVQAGFLEPGVAAAAAAEPLGAVAASTQPGLGPIVGAEYGTQYFIEEVRIQVDQLFPEGDLYDQGLRVYTTLDHGRQRAAYAAAYEDRVEDLRSRGLPELGPTSLDPADPDEPAAAVVTIDRSGHVLAMVGGTNFPASPYNLVTHRGGTGRAADSIMHVLGLIDYASTSFDPYGDVVLEGGEPRCAEGTSAGRPKKVVSPVRDFIDGNNRAMADLMELTDLRSLIDLGQRLGLSDRIGTALDLDDECALILGRVPVSPLDVANLYATLERGGRRLAPVMIERIESAAGEVLCWYPVDGVCAESPDRAAIRVLDQEVVDVVNSALMGAAAEGSGDTAVLAAPGVAGTGATSLNNRDAWFAGYACGVSTVVWVGFHEDSPRPMFDFRRLGSGIATVDADSDPVNDPDWPDIEGTNIPAWIWHDAMSQGPAGWECGPGEAADRARARELAGRGGRAGARPRPEPPVGAHSGS